jgi:hypothetical protein
MGAWSAQRSGVYAALQASGGDDARASALIVLAILATATLGTVFVASILSLGLVATAGRAVLFTLVGCSRFPLFQHGEDERARLTPVGMTISTLAAAQSTRNRGKFPSLT